MEILVFLAFCGLIVSGGFIAAFIWSARNGQYDDLATPPVRILIDDMHQRTVTKNSNEYDTRTE